MKKRAKKSIYQDYSLWIVIAVIIILIILVVYYFQGDMQKNKNLNTPNNSKPKDSNADIVKKSYSKTDQDVTLFFEDYKFINIGDNFGKISEITYSLNNNGSATILPMLYIVVSDYSISNGKEIILGDSLNPGDSISHKTVPVNLVIGRSEDLKKIELIVYGIVSNMTYKKTLITSVEFETNLTEGFK